MRVTSTRHKVIFGNRRFGMVQLLFSSVWDGENFSLASSNATCFRRSVIQYKPKSRELPKSTTVGTSARALAVKVGKERLIGAATKPSFSKGTSERKNTDVPPTSSLP